MTFFVDLPNDRNAWTPVGEFETKADAVTYIRLNIDHNCDDDGNICLISEIENTKEHDDTDVICLCGHTIEDHVKEANSSVYHCEVNNCGCLDYKEIEK